MPKPNGRNDVIGAIAGVPGWLNQVYYPFATYGSGDWIDDETLIVADATNGGMTRIWRPFADPTGVARVPAWTPDSPANDVAAGGGKFIALAAWASSPVLYGSMGAIAGAGFGHVARDGTIAFKTEYFAYDGVTIIPPGNTRQWPPKAEALWPDDLPADWGWIQVPGARNPYDIQALPGGKALWRGGAYGRPPAQPFYTDAMGLQLVVVGREEFLLYWSNGRPGLIFQPDGIAEGYVLDTEGLAFNSHVIGGLENALIVSSRGQGEAPNELCKIFCNRNHIEYAIDWKADRVPAVWGSLEAPEPGPDPIIPIGRRCWLAWFTDGAKNTPGNADLFVDYHGEGLHDNIVRRRDGKPAYLYVAAEADGTLAGLEKALAKARLTANGLPLLAYMPPSLQTGPAPRGADVCGLEAYRKTTETLAVFEARVRAAVNRFTRVALIAQCYTSNASNTLNIQTLVPVYSRIARDNLNVEAIIPFSAGSRGSGWDQHAEVQPLWQTLANGIIGTPPIVPIEPPKPDPPKPPVDKYPIAIPYKETTMNPQTMVIRGTGNKLMRVDSSRPGQGLFRGYPVLYDRDDPNDAECRFELTRPDERYQLRNIKTNEILGEDATEHSADACKQLYTSGGDVHERGAYESWDVFRLKPGGKIYAIITAFGDGRYTGLALTLEEV